MSPPDELSVGRQTSAQAHLALVPAYARAPHSTMKGTLQPAAVSAAISRSLATHLPPFLPVEGTIDDQND
jgi:hypothetical protein